MAEQYSQTGTGLSTKANMIRLVKVVQESDGNPGSFPNTVSPVFYKCMPATVQLPGYDPSTEEIDPTILGPNGTPEGLPVTIVDCTDDDRAIYVANFRNNSPVLNNYYLVFRLNNGVYIFDNPMAFLLNN